MQKLIFQITLDVFARHIRYLNYLKSAGFNPKNIKNCYSKNTILRILSCAPFSDSTIAGLKVEGFLSLLFATL